MNFEIEKILDFGAIFRLFRDPYSYLNVLAEDLKRELAIYLAIDIRSVLILIDIMEQNKLINYNISTKRFISVDQLVFISQFKMFNENIEIYIENNIGFWRACWKKYISSICEYSNILDTKKAFDMHAQYIDPTNEWYQYYFNRLIKVNDEYDIIKNSGKGLNNIYNSLKTTFSYDKDDFNKVENANQFIGEKLLYNAWICKKYEIIEILYKKGLQFQKINSSLYIPHFSASNPEFLEYFNFFVKCGMKFDFKLLMQYAVSCRNYDLINYILSNYSFNRDDYEIIPIYGTNIEHLKQIFYKYPDMVNKIDQYGNNLLLNYVRDSIYHNPHSHNPKSAPVPVDNFKYLTSLISKYNKLNLNYKNTYDQTLLSFSFLANYDIYQVIMKLYIIDFFSNNIHNFFNNNTSDINKYKEFEEYDEIELCVYIKEKYNVEESLIEKFRDEIVNYKDTNKRNFLTNIFSFYDQEEETYKKLKSIISLGADLNYNYRYGSETTSIIHSALKLCVDRGSPRMLKLLLDNGSHVFNQIPTINNIKNNIEQKNCEDDCGDEEDYEDEIYSNYYSHYGEMLNECKSVLFYCIVIGVNQIRINIFKMLIDYGYDINYKYRGISLGLISLTDQYFMPLLLEAGFDYKQKSKKGLNLLMQFCNRRMICTQNDSILKFLDIITNDGLNNKAIDEVDCEGNPMIFYAMAYDYDSIVIELLRRGANINIKNNKHQNIAMYCFSNLKKRIEHKIKLSRHYDNYDITSIENRKLLTQLYTHFLNRTNINDVDINGDATSTYFIQNSQSIKDLFVFNPNFSLINIYNKTPLDYLNARSIRSRRYYKRFHSKYSLKYAKLDAIKIN